MERGVRVEVHWTLPSFATHCKNSAGHCLLLLESDPLSANSIQQIPPSDTPNEFFRSVETRNGTVQSGRLAIGKLCAFQDFAQN